PVMAVENVRWPDMFGDFNGSAREFTVAFCVVGKIASRSPVNSVTIEISRIVHKEIANAIQQRSIRDAWKPQAISHRYGQTGNDCSTGLRSPVFRQHHG